MQGCYVVKSGKMSYLCTNFWYIRVQIIGNGLDN